MKKIFFFLIINLIISACYSDRLKNIVDFEKVQNELNCDPVTQDKFNDYFIEFEYEDFVNQFPSFIIRKNKEVIFFCETKEKDFNIVFWKDNEILDKIDWPTMGEIHENFNEILDLKFFLNLETNKLSNINKKIIPPFLISEPNSVIYFAKYNNEWYYRAFD